MGTIIGIIALAFCWLLIAAANKQHHDETGINAPTRGAMRRIRRKARQKGISEAQAYLGWLDRKRGKRASKVGTDFEYSADTRSKTALVQDIEDPADAPLRARAASRDLSLRRQHNGLYFFLILGNQPGTMVRNPARPDSYDFTRDEVIRFLDD